MAETVAYQILQALKTRLDGISTGGGYNTDPTIVLGVQPTNPDALSGGDPLIAIYEVDDDPTDESTLLLDQLITLRVVIEATVQFGNDSTALALSRLWQDINSAVFTTDTTLGGIAESVLRGPRSFNYPQPGGETVAVMQTVNVQYIEPYGNP